MRFANSVFFICVVCIVVALPPAALQAQNPPEEKPQAAAAMPTEQYSDLSHELRRIHREIAALRADLDEPGIKDVFGGIGYILGLCGSAALVAARRRESRT